MTHWLKFNVVGLLGFALQSVALFVLTHTSHSLNYLAATGLRPGPIAIVLEPLPNGRMKNACFFYLKL